MKLTGYEFLTAFLVFVVLMGAGTASLRFHRRLPDRYRDEDTATVIRLIASIFVVMTSLVLGLMINSAKNTFELADRNVHAMATETILLDKMLRRLGDLGDTTRQQLIAYARYAKAASGSKSSGLVIGDVHAEMLLDRAGDELRAIRPSSGEQMVLWQEAMAKFQRIFDLRWKLIEQADGTIKPALLFMVVAWLIVIFASVGFRAPFNMMVMGGIFVSSILMATTIYLIIDMDIPFGGPMSVSREPVDRVLLALTR